MEIGQAFTFVNKDDDWIKKLGLGALFVLIPFLIILIVGYQIAIIRNVMKGEERPLPDWDEFGQLFIDGLIIIVSILVYALPIILISLCGSAIGFLTADSGGGWTTGGIVGNSLFGCIALLYGLALAFLTPALFIQYARTGEFGTLFQVGEVVAIARGNLVDILLAIIVIFVANFLLFIIGVISVITICGPLIVFTAGTAWVYYTTAHLYGQIGRKMNDNNLETAYDAA